MAGSPGSAPANWIAADILRIEYGVFVEHWDVIRTRRPENSPGAAADVRRLVSREPLSALSAMTRCWSGINKQNGKVAVYPGSGPAHTHNRGPDPGGPALDARDAGRARELVGRQSGARVPNSHVLPDSGLVLRGRAKSHHAKQLALQASWT